MPAFGCLVSYIPSEVDPKKRPKMRPPAVDGIFLGWKMSAGGKPSDQAYVIDLEEFNTINFRDCRRIIDKGKPHVDTSINLI